MIDRIFDLDRDPEKWDRFSEKIMLKQEMRS